MEWFRSIALWFIHSWTGWKRHDVLVYDKNSGNVTVWIRVNIDDIREGWEQVRRGWLFRKAFRVPNELPAGGLKEFARRQVRLFGYAVDHKEFQRNEARPLVMGEAVIVGRRYKAGAR